MKENFLFGYGMQYFTFFHGKTQLLAEKVEWTRGDGWIGFDVEAFANFESKGHEEEEP